MTEQRQPTGAVRRLVFENAINGVQVADIMVAFLLSEAEVNAAVDFVGRKITEYRFRRCMPPLTYETPYERALNRYALLETLRKLGDQYLSSSLLIPKIGVHKLTDLGQAKEATRKVGASSE